MTEKSEPYEETVLRITERYVAEVRAGRQPRLSDYLPHDARQAAAIADFVAYYHTVEEQQASPVQTEHLAPLSPRSQTILEHLKDMPACPSTLLCTLKGRLLSPCQLAQALNLSSDLVLQLEQRQLDPATIPAVLHRRLSRRLGYSVTAIYAFLKQPASGQNCITTTHFDRLLKVAEQPSAYPEYRNSFRSALEASTKLTAEQKAIWYTTLIQECL